MSQKEDSIAHTYPQAGIYASWNLFVVTYDLNTPDSVCSNETVVKITASYLISFICNYCKRVLMREANEVLPPLMAQRGG
jgi:hypothetical protein